MWNSFATALLILKPNYLSVLNLSYCGIYWWKTQWITVAGGKHEPVQLAFVLYFSLFGNFKFISLPSQWNWWWSLLFQLKCILKPAGEYVWQPESLLLLGPLNASCPSLVALPQPEVTRVKAYLVRRSQPYVVSMDGFVIMCLSPQHFMELKCLSAAAVKVGVAHCMQTDSSGWLGLFGVGLGTSSQAFVYLPQTSRRNKRTGEVCAKGYTSTSYKNANAASGLLRVFSDVQ